VTPNGSPPGADADSDADADLDFPAANIAPVEQLGSALGTTLGPVSMDKLIVDPADPSDEADPARPAVDDVTVTNDGATILDTLPMAHPVATIVERVVGPERPGETDVEGKDIHEGITTTVVVTAALLSEARRLLELGVHPQTIRQGYEHGLDAARGAIDRERRAIEDFEDPQAAKRSVARTAMTGNAVGNASERWIDFALDAVDHVGVPDEHTFLVRETSAGAIDDARFVKGTVLNRNEITHDAMPTRIEDADVLILGGHGTGRLGDRKPNRKSSVSSVELESADQLRAHEDAEYRRKERIVDRIESLGTDVVVTRLGVDSEFQELFVHREIATVRRVTQRNIRALARATGATIVQDVGDLSSEYLGRAGLVEQLTMAATYPDRRKTRRMIVFDDCLDPGSVSVLLTGLQRHVGAQATRQIRKAAKSVALAVGEGTDLPGVVPGAGAIQLSVADAVRNRPATDSKSQLAVEAYADAVESVVGHLVTNAGHDQLSVVPDLRTAREAGETAVGFVLAEGEIQNSVEAGVLDPAATVRRGLVVATQVANAIVTIDDALDAVDLSEKRDPDDVIYDDQAKKTEAHLEEES
jgi:chaperonin GroEL (HSP60 family)